MILALCAILWMEVGYVMFMRVDNGEMKKEVPYGDLPSILSLKQIRASCLVVSVAIGCGFLISIGAAYLYESVRLEVTRRLLERRLSRLLKRRVWIKVERALKGEK
jgi:hypothetical protein